MERERLIEFFIGLVFIIFLVFVVVLVLNIGDGTNKNNSKSSTSSSGNTIINNYYENNYNYPEKSMTGNVVYKYSYKGDVVYKGRNLDYEDYYGDYWNDNDFSSSGRHRKIKNSFNYVDEYSVVVKNEDHVGKYFKVVFSFNFEDNFEDSQSVIKYIKPRETKEFIYRDAHFERYNYESWDYEVFSQDNGFR